MTDTRTSAMSGDEPRRGSVKPLTEQEVREMAEAITGGEGDDRDGWYGAAEARVLAHDCLRLQHANRQLSELVLEVEAELRTHKQRLAEAERERDKDNEALEAYRAERDWLDERLTRVEAQLAKAQAALEDIIDIHEGWTRQMNYGERGDVTKQIARDALAALENDVGS